MTGAKGKGPSGKHDREGRSDMDEDRESRVRPSERVEESVLPVTEERARVGKRPVERGSVRVRTEPTERTETVETELTRNDVEVERVPVGREVDSRVPVREEGDVTVVPVHEEVLVVTKRLVLKEEIRLRRTSRKRTESVEVDLRSEEPIVERVEPDGGVDAQDVRDPGDTK